MSIKITRSLSTNDKMENFTFGVLTKSPFRETNRQTDRQTDRKTDTDTDTQTDRWVDGWTGSWTLDSLTKWYVAHHDVKVLERVQGCAK